MFSPEFSCNEQVGCKGTGKIKDTYCQCMTGQISTYYDEHCCCKHTAEGINMICNQKKGHDGWHYNSNKNIAWENKTSSYYDQ